MHQFLTLFIALFTLAAPEQPKPQSDYARDWRRADSLASRGLPKSAMEIATRIYAEAKEQKNYPQVAKAAMARMIFRSYSDEDAYVKLVESLKDDIRETPEPAKSVLQSVMADIYWQYFQQNRYKFYNRATVSRGAVGKTVTPSNADNQATSSDTLTDFRTWDAHHLMEAITAAYLASVQEKTILQNTPIAAFDVLLDKGDADTRPLRPTLYDLLAHRAIGFFQNTEPDLLKPTFKFELDQPDYLAEPAVFTKLPIQSRDSLSGRYQALLLYQQLLAFHLSDNQPDALADADVLRLSFVHQYSVVPNKDSLYRKILEGQITRFKNQPTEAVYAYQLAEFLTNYGNPVRPLDDSDEPTSEPAKPNPSRWNNKQAADICRDLIKRYPKTFASQKAAQLLEQLLQATFSIQIEGVNAPKQPFRAFVTYQNVPKILYRIVSVTTSERQTDLNLLGNDEEKRKKVLNKWLKRAKVAENTVVLPDDGDLQSHSVEIPLTGLPIGHYLLLTTADDKFQDKPESVQYDYFTVSTLSYFLSPDNMDDSSQALFVMNRLTGEPIKNASVALMTSNENVSSGRKGSFVTSIDGEAKIPFIQLPTQNRFYYQIAVGADTLISDQHYHYQYNRDRDGEESRTYTKLFTDRAIYRPGQLIYVKGLLYNGKSNQFGVVANEEVEVEFRDQNGERIAEQTLKTNEFGTFEATFTAPVGRLTGVMTLKTDNGSTTVRVEEYKRPTFEVKTKPILQSFKLGQTVKVTAEAKTYSGAVVDKADVRYRVVRKLYERWYWWYRPRSSNQTEIANGTAQTDERGNVKIAFTALPDLEKSRQGNPIFDFEVTIDVTDRAGETRSTTQTLRIGYSALQAELIIPAQIEKDEPSTFPIKITNQSGEKVSAKGQLTVYKLQPPTRPLRNRLWSRPDRQFLSQAEFEKLFPNDLYANETDPRSWPKGAVVQQQTIISPADSVFKPELAKYAAGEYVAELTVTDSAGATTRDQAFFVLVDEKRPIASARPDGWLQVRKATAEPGENAIFWVGNSQPGWVLMTVEENHAVARQEWIKTDGQPKKVTLPVTEKQRGGFAVHFAMVQNGRLYQKSQIITVPFTNKQLTIETQTFRNKLKPGEREEWTLKISGLNKAPAEMVATLYDASLDIFDRLDWPTSVYQTYSLYWGDWESYSFNASGSNVLFYRYRQQAPTPVKRYDQLSWLGYRFSVYGNRPFQHAPIGTFGLADNALRASVRRDGKTIKGTIKSTDGSETPGVSILVKGTKVGTTTNSKGEFSLTVDSDSKPVTLIFSYIGYVTQEVVINKSKTFQLPPDTQQLNEVVVVGYGMQAKRSVTGAVARMAAPMQDGMANLQGKVAGVAVTESTPKPVPSPVINPRTNFNETAFFLPQLKTDDRGRVVLKFTMPEALTRWRLLAFAHTKDLKTGTLEREIITQKELMITANSPRFLREGDTIRVTARINNLSEKALPVTASLTLLDALTGEPVNQKLKLTNTQTMVNVAAGQGQSVGWTLIVPANLDAVTCRFTAQSGTFTDGEEFTVPVLPNRMLVIDSQPFWVNGRETKEFKLKPLTGLNPELPVQHERLTVEVTSNPSWYALQSLPYLMEYRYECAEQLFSRLYANSLATHIVGSKPVFKQVIAEWQKNPPKSPLEKNEELRAVSLENSPWLVSARSESDRQAKLGQLLDANRMESEQLRAFEKLKQLQTAGGGFRWFGGMSPDFSMTLHILSGFGHLQKLGVQFPKAMQSELNDMQTNAIHYADAEMKRWIDEEKKAEKQKKNTGIGSWYFSATQYLYARSFYLDKPVDKTLLAYVKKRVADDWLNQSLQGEALAAMALNRFGDTKTANGIVNSMRERSRKSEELGMYWPDNQSGLYWYQTPIETQAYLIEAFGEINPVLTEVDDMKRWLLRQKQTQSWSSTKATTEAIYALLLRGSDWLGTGVTTQVSLGGQPIENRVTKADAITGYEKVTYAASEIKPAMGVIQISKKADGPAWGALYWQHFEPLDKVMPGSAGLSVQKTLYVQHDSPSGPIISPVTAKTSLKPGDLIKVRLILKTDRTMQYVHLKDSRASGFEPVAALSGYKYQNGLGYYEAPRDASTDFFMSYLPVGTHVFEYDLRVAQTGDFSAGVATVQCFYAPEFSAHSAGGRVSVK
ncbi:alpha-2-macroglobulin family protein [Spirosoma foliorum]|uniref:Carboxypeptidase-like regulatory domain-containing protein n=1 Tax=Spirosoma foliorum TaxID=2710596 RepID=A0A7G5GTC6_9BACT|nr:alpha-2-macroglobulin family protein [Spirosoma foliorum]QMW02118.1 carboxypeptidase-like regulatory domain-containing protein [Spirosoma foliorum]